MKKINLGKSTATVNKNVNRKSLYLDNKHADSIKKDIIKQLNDISKTYDKLSEVLNKMSYKKMCNESYNSISLQCSKECHTQKDFADRLVKDIEYKYNDDLKTLLIKNLDERISYLEKKFLSNK